MNTYSQDTLSALRPAALGLALAILTILFGQLLGIVFGLNEESIKSRLQASATQVRDTVYHGDDAAIKTVQEKSWTYMKRAHLHAGSMGTTAVALIVLVSLVGLSRAATTAISLGLGAGGLGYSVFWMWAANSGRTQSSAPWPAANSG